MAGSPAFRKSQGIVPYGVGAIVDFPEDSLMAAGLDMWPQVSTNMPSDVKARVEESTRIIDGRLQRRLSAAFGRPITRFLSPAEAPERKNVHAQVNQPDSPRAYMPFVRFPRWHFCPRCRTLWEVPWNTPSGDKKLRCNSDVRLKEGTGQTCAKLPSWRMPRLIPVRFAVACAHGHITDFPWQDWAHLDQRNCGAGSGQLFLVATGAAGLAGVEVRCSSCSARRTLVGAFGQDHDPFRRIWPYGCTGERPWLGPNATQADCPERPTTIQRGASNAYFANTENSILIPPYSRLLQQVLDRPDVRRQIDATQMIDGKLHRPSLVALAENHGLDPDTFVAAVDELLESGSEELPAPVTEEEYRRAEYTAFLGPRPPASERRDFDLSPRSIDEYSADFRSYFDRVVMIPKLRETRVLTGFTRIVPSASSMVTADLSLTPQNWLPAMEVRGEGVFVVVRRDRLADWMSMNTEIEQRIQAINSRLAKVAQERGFDEAREITGEFLLVHTLAHALVRQLVFDCGYDSSSLRERVYVGSDGGDQMSGLLIYTASGDSEGTLGGLVRQGLPGRLEATVDAAIRNAGLCSSDPLCIESKGQGINGLNLSACHACTLLPETSCEEGNRLLDRALLIGTPDNPDLGFFADMIKN